MKLSYPEAVRRPLSSNLIKNIHLGGKPIIIDSSKYILELQELRKKDEQILKLQKLEQELQAKLKDADDRIAKAEAQAKEIVEQAGKMKTELKKKLEEEKLATDFSRQKIFNQAEEEGFEKGFESGVTEGRASIGTLIENAANILAETFSAKENILKASEEQVVSLALAIARKIMNMEIETRREAVVATVKEAVKRIMNSESYILFLNPEDIISVKDKLDEIKSVLPHGARVYIREDDKVKCGGCIVSTELGTIDSTMETQLLELDRLFMDLTREKQGGSKDI